MLKFEMLPAGHGDCLWIEYGEPVRRILIDGGPWYSYRALRSRIEALDESDRHFELLIVTHVDADHIEGVLRLLQEPHLGVTFGDVWFNGTDQINAAIDEGDLLDERQGEYLQALLTKRGAQWNGAFDGKVIVVPEDGPLPSIPLEGDAFVTIVSPRAAELRSLGARWTDLIESEGFSTGDTDKALAALATKDRLQPLDALGDEAPEDQLGEADDPPGSDRSVANGSSIAIVLEHAGHRLLLAGDAFPDVLEGSLRRLEGGAPVALSLFKLPHHGSIRNMTDDVIEVVACDRFAISSNGSYFGHPHARAIDLLLNALPDDVEPELWFNYLSDETEPWCDPETERRLHYVAKHPAKSDEPGAAITFEPR